MCGLCRRRRKLRWLSRAVSFFRNVTGRQKDELDIAAEVSAHLELLIEARDGLADCRSRRDLLAAGGVEPLAGRIPPSHLGFKGSREVMPGAIAAERAALLVDPLLPEAHAMMGVCLGEYEFDWLGAEKHWRVAMSREPLSRDVLFWYGNHYLIPMGRTSEGLDVMERVLDADPLNLLYRHLYARGLRLAGRVQEAETELRTILEIDPDYPHALGTLGLLCAQRRRFEEALLFSERAHASIPWSTLVSGQLAATLLLTGDRDGAEFVLDQIRSQTEHLAPIGLTAFHGLCGEIDEAANWAERAIEQRYMPFVHNLSIYFGKTPWASRFRRLMNLPS